MERGLPQAKPDPDEIYSDELAIEEYNDPDENRVEHEDIFKEPNLNPVKKGRRRKAVIAPPVEQEQEEEEAPKAKPKRKSRAKKKVFEENTEASEEEEPPVQVIDNDKILTANGKLISKKQYAALEKARRVAAKNKTARRNATILAGKQGDSNEMNSVLQSEAPIRSRALNAAEVEAIATKAVRAEKARRSSAKAKKNEIAEIKRQAKLELLEEQRSQLSASRPAATPKKNLTASDLLHQGSGSSRYGYLFNNF